MTFKSRASRRIALAVASGAGVVATSTLLIRAPYALTPFDAPDAAARYFEQRRAPRDANADRGAMYARAAERARGMARFASRNRRVRPAALAPASAWVSNGRVVALGEQSELALLDAWTPLGPGNIGGRTRAIAFHPGRPDTIFAAGVSGGIWRTNDAGASWVPIADSLANIAVNVLAIDRRRPEVMYAGTGEGYLREEIRGTGLPIRGDGVFVSRDGGAAWRQLPATANENFFWVNDLVLSAPDSRRLYAATRTGVWRSLDGGDTWVRLLDPAVRGGCLDLALRQDQPEDILFASCGTFQPATVYRFANAAAAGAAEPVLREPGMGRTSLAIAPSNPDIIYALAAGNDPGPQGLYEQALLGVFRSERGGAAGTWTPRVTNTDPQKIYTLLLTNALPAMSQDCGRGAANSFINMGWYTNTIAVDPLDADRVWAAGVDWFRSDDGGRTWGVASYWAVNASNTSFAHADQHALVFHPQFDGDRNQVAILSGDGGGYVAIDPTNPLVMYAESQWAAIIKSVDGGSRFAGAARGLDPVRSSALGPDGNYLFIAPFLMDPSQPRRLWTGGDHLYRTEDGAGLWTMASAQLPDGGLTSALAVADRDSNRVAAGTSNGYVLSSKRALSETAESAWTASRPRDGWVTSVALDQRDANVVYVTYGNYGGTHVFRSDDGGTSWRALDGTGPAGLPDIPVHCLVIDPADPLRIYLGTDLGVFVSVDGGREWMAEHTGFGAIITEWLALTADASGHRRLFAFTHGRGVWRVDL